MNRIQTIECFEAMCEAMGEHCTEDQKARLTSWALKNFGPADYRLAGEIALESGISDLYTEFSMRCGEMGQ